MAKGKKKNTPRPTVRRPPRPSAVSPGEMAPATAPSFRDQTKKVQENMLRSVATAGKEAYGYPIRMSDAVQARVDMVSDAITRSPSGVPEGLGWYQEHQEDAVDVTRRANIDATAPVSAGNIINASAMLSNRNTPVQERRAARSAGWIASHPEHEVDITPHMSESVTTVTKGTVGVPVGKSRLGQLNADQIAALGTAETNLIKTTGGTRSLERGITSATLDSAGRHRATPAIRAARGERMEDIVKDGPKILNYAEKQHTITPQESAYNREVFWRRANDTSVDSEGTTWKQGHLFSAAEFSGFTPPDIKDDSTVEDYIAYALSARKASQLGKTGASANDAQDLVGKKIRKGPQGTFPADLTPSEIGHAVNEEATRQASRRFGAVSYLGGNDSESSIAIEFPTAGGGVQPAFWVEYQHQNNPKSGDSEIKKRNKALLASEGEQVQGSLFPDLVPEVNQFGKKPKKKRK